MELVPSQQTRQVRGHLCEEAGPACATHNRLHVNTGCSRSDLDSVCLPSDGWNKRSNNASSMLWGVGFAVTEAGLSFSRQTCLVPKQHLPSQDQVLHYCPIPSLLQRNTVMRLMRTPVAQAEQASAHTRGLALHLPSSKKNMLQSVGCNPISETIPYQQGAVWLHHQSSLSSSLPFA